MRMRRSLFPLQSQRGAPRKSIGGAKAYVQDTSEALVAAPSDKPAIASRIYSPPSLSNFDESDPRYQGKSDAVENIYLPSRFAATETKPRSGFQQLLNWLTKGELR